MAHFAAPTVLILVLSNSVLSQSTDMHSGSFPSPSLTGTPTSAVGATPCPELWMNLFVGSGSGSGDGDGLMPTVTTSATPPSSSAPPFHSPTPAKTSSPSSSSLNPPPPSDASSNRGDVTALVIGVIVSGAVLAVAVVCVTACCCKYHRPRKNTKRHPDGKLSGEQDCLLEYPMVELGVSVGDEKGDFGSEALFQHIPAEQLPSVSASDFPDHVLSLNEDDCRQGHWEYHFIKSIDPLFAKNSAVLHYNMAKNRYTNIFPYDATRVMLSSSPTERGSDYINANYIAGYSGGVEYIATQGPLYETLGDFWRMVWEKNVHIIIMVTNLMEKGMNKCCHYWPSAYDGVEQCGAVLITFEGEKCLPAFTTRYFTLTNVEDGVTVTRQIQQFHFTAWPDFGVPSNCTSMLKFVRRIRGQVSNDHGPIVCHCSAGVGRTGTYIAVDVMLQRIANSQPLNIPEFVCQMRAQRTNMVQTNEQYFFIYRTVLHALLYGDTEVGVASLSDHLSFLQQSAEGNEEETHLDREFKLAMAAADVGECSVALSQSNAPKNRFSTDIPFNYNRVQLESGFPGKDYINASWVRGYWGEDAFIVTQQPLMETKEEFWRMAVKNGVTTIVAIGPLRGFPEEEGAGQEEEDEWEDTYWPREAVAGYGGITVELVSLMMEENELAVRELQVECTQSGERADIQHYHLWAWPEDDGAPPILGSLVSVLRQRREESHGVIVLHTTPSLGSSDVCGVLCAVSNLLDEAQLEGSVDVVAAVQQLRAQRPAILGRKDYYKLIYEMLVKALD